MNEDVFLVFALLGTILVIFCLRVVRHCEDAVLWMRYRLSSALWISVTAMIAAGFINMSDLWLLLVAWLCFSAYLVRQIARHYRGTRWKRLAWFSLVFLPLSGWILYFSRFPQFHAVDAHAARMDAEDAMDGTAGTT